MHRPEGDQHGEALAYAAKGRANEEYDQTDLEHGPPAVEVAHLAVQGRDHGLSQQVGRSYPRNVVEAAEVASHRGEGGGHDRGVQRRDEHHEHQPDEDDRQIATVELVRPVSHGCPGDAFGLPVAPFVSHPPGA